MKKIVYILLLATLLLFSCSKEQPLTPISSTELIEPEMFKGCATDDGEDKDNEDVYNDDITDPEDPDKEKTNKNARKN